MDALGIIGLLAIVLAVAATVLAFIFIIPDKKRAGLNGIGKFLHDTLNFKYLIVEKILQALYVFATAFVVLTGFFLLFYVQSGYDYGYYSTPAKWFGGYGLLIMIVGPIAVRLAYAFLMMAVLLVKNVIQINGKLKNANGGKQRDIFSAPAMPTVEKDRPAPQAQAQQYQPQTQAIKCPICGIEVEEGSFCPACGTKVR